MNSFDLLEAIGLTDDASLQDAEGFRAAPFGGGRARMAQATYMKRGIIAAAVCLFCAGAVMALWFIPDRRDPSPPFDESAGETYKKPLSAIPNAVVVELRDAVAVQDDRDGDIYTPEEYTRVLKERFITVVGEADNIQAVCVPDGDYLWYIATFDITVTKPINFMAGKEVMRCVTYVRCFSDGSPTVDCGIPKLAMKLTEQPQGFFVGRSLEENEFFGRDPVPFSLTAYADYYVGVRFDCTDESFSYYGEEIRFADIRR